MKSIRNFLVLLLLLPGTSGCVSSYKHVMVSVVDETTGQPVAGATVSTYYVVQRFSLASRRTSTSVTDANGTAVLLANYLPHEPVLFGHSEPFPFHPMYDVDITNDKYEQHTSDTGSALEDGPLLSRPVKFIPTTPDFVEEIASEKAIAGQRAQDEKRREADEQKADELNHRSPDFWPAPDDDWLPKDEINRLLVERRWENASKVSLGNEQDIDSIKRAVLRNLTLPKSEVGEIRWVSQSVVMVHASWYEAPLAAGAYTYVLQKRKDGWTVLTRYLIAIA